MQFEIKALDPKFHDLIDVDAEFESVSTGHSVTEGIIWWKEKNCLVFSDMWAGKVYAWDPETFETKVIKQFSNPVFSRFTKKFSDGAIIMSEYTSAKSFYFVQSGKVVIEKYINGVMKRYGVIRPGEIFGDMEILQESPRQSSAIAKGSVTCLKFSKENFNSVVISSPNVAMLMLRLICKRIFEQRRNLQILCIKDLSARIADIMLMCIENEGAVGEDEDDMKRKINVTVDDIAMIAGLSVNSTRDELNKFTSRNKIAIYDGYMIVANVMDMKRTVDTYYTNLEEEEAKQKQQQQAKK